MRISSRTAQAKTYKYCFNGYVIENFKLLSHLIQSTPRIRRNINLKSVLCDDNAKIYQVSSSVFFFILIITGLLNLLFPYLVFPYLVSILFEFFYVIQILLLIGILLLRPYELIETPDSY